MVLCKIKTKKYRESKNTKETNEQTYDKGQANERAN